MTRKVGVRDIHAAIEPLACPASFDMHAYAFLMGWSSKQGNLVVPACILFMKPAWRSMLTPNRNSEAVSRQSQVLAAFVSLRNKAHMD
jgi:hypothetical protein